MINRKTFHEKCSLNVVKMLVSRFFILSLILYESYSSLYAIVP